MTFPVKAIARPAVLAGQRNGRLDTRILIVIPGQEGGPTVRLVEPAATAWRALCAAAKAAGHVLKASGPADSYRPYDVQERIFRQRYTTTYLPGRPSRMWNGQRWFQKPGTAAAAVPGSSNHGDAIAVDTGVERDGDPSAESIDEAPLAWLLDHADEFGWSWELQSEPWHLHYFAGDVIPPAVAAFAAQPTTEETVIDMIAKNADDAARGEVRRLYLELTGEQPSVPQLADGVNTVEKSGYEALVTSIADSAAGQRFRAAQRKLLGLA